jgi:RNA-directed DNA polymerase
VLRQNPARTPPERGGAADRGYWYSRTHPALSQSGIMIERTLVPSEEGTPQGGIASPLLANMYLQCFDEWYSQHYGVPDKQTDKRAYFAWQRRRFKGKDQAAVQMFRYADDWILVIRGTEAQAQDIKEACKTVPREEMGLELSEEKTKITHIEDGFDFWGFAFFAATNPQMAVRLASLCAPPTKA